MSNRRMMKILVLGVALLMALPVVASAQMSRVEGMGIQGDYIKDWSNIFTYTSQVGNVGNLVYGETGNVDFPPVTSDRMVGAVIGTLWDGDLGTWSIHLREQTPQLGQGDGYGNPAPGSGGSDPNFHSMESFDLMWGKKFGTTSVGLRLNRSFGSLEGDLFALGLGSLSKIETDDIFLFSDPNFQRNILGVAAGFGFEMSPTTSVELNGTWQSRTFLLEDSTGVKVYEDDGPTTYQIAARAMWQWQPNVMVVPVFKWYSYDLSIKAAGPPVTAVENTLTGWQLGAAGNWALGSNDLFVLGTTFAQNKLEMSNSTFETTETLTPQVFAALETHVNPWLTLRFGAQKAAWWTIESRDNTIPATVKFKGSDFEMRLGAGIKLGNLQMDAVLDSSFPNNMPYLISGDDTSDMFTKVTLTYPW